jgi:hypothetical protein
VSTTYLPAALRQLVRERANLRCEYCHLAESDAFLPHEPDHIIAEKHGGASTADNLALSCFDCNRFKGSDVASYDSESGQLTPLFNPRTQSWAQHFSIAGGEINGLTSVGRTTGRLLRFNLAARVEVRKMLALKKRWPG